MRTQIISVLLLVCSVVFALGAAPANSLGQKKEPEKKSEPAKPAAGKAAKGKALYDEWCEICHFNESTEKKIGPGLKGLFKRGKFSDGRKVDDAALRTWIEKGGKDMPGFGDSIKQEEIRELIAYLKTL
jgi:cytochrome c2